MFPAFVIGLREGLEAALIVGIVAAFLRRNAPVRALRSMWIGVGAAVAICLAFGIALNALAKDLPESGADAMAAIISVAAVVMVTYMIVWMKRNSRTLKRTLEDAASTALQDGSTTALTVMAFLAVVREGLETSVFLVATFQGSGVGAWAPVGVLLGIGLAVLIGYLIYRGGIRINLSRFFRATGVVLAFVAAGLVVSALHKAADVGWIGFGQQEVLNLSWIADPDTVQGALVFGVLGLREHPVVLEVVGWLAYLVPVVTVVLWQPSRRKPQPQVSSQAATAR